MDKQPTSAKPHSRATEKLSAKAAPVSGSRASILNSSSAVGVRRWPRLLAAIYIGSVALLTVWGAFVFGKGQSIGGARPAAASSAAEQAPLMFARYQLQAGGTVVFDTHTGLRWQRCSIGQRWTGGQCAGKASVFYPEQLEALNSNEWRVPTVHELATLIWCENSRYVRSDQHGVDQRGLAMQSCDGDDRDTKIRPTVFPNTPAFVYWSSTSNPESAESWYGVWFEPGSAGLLLVGADGYVRMVAR